MLSILIPIYNQSVLNLVRELSDQASHLDCTTEIICLDDASDTRNKVPNQQLHSIPNVRYEELPENIGRSKIRNLLASKSQQPFLLFLDGDSEVINSDFLSQYLLNINDEAVVVGGRVFPELCPSPEKRLHWLTGRYREQKQSSAFQSNNFLIPAHIFKEIKFDESLSGYGHEDTLFGYELAHRGAAVLHIKNPTNHGQLENAQNFLHNQREAAINLAKISESNPSLETPLIETARRLQSLRIAGLVRLLLTALDPLLSASLLGRSPTLLSLDLYKLGAFLRAGKNQ